MIYSLSELIQFAREKSPYYSRLYRNLSEGPLSLEQLPILDQADFWKANSWHDNQVWTGPLADGIVFKSGGTTGSPKFSVFSRDEWRAFTSAFGRGMNRGGLCSGDRVANLFYCGELYASFLFITSSVENAPEPAFLLPISGAVAPTEVVETLHDLQADVLAVVPTSVLSLAEHLERSGKRLPKVRKILFGGESMHADQRRYLEKIFQGAEIRSIGYASVDAGLLGFADSQCAPDEHRCFSNETIIEIIDEATGQVIDDVEAPGRVVITNLTRKLMPIIRYPAGDRAVWVEGAESGMRKFRLLGRSEEAARVGPATLYYEDISRLLEPFAHDLSLQGFQLVLEHDDMKDRVTMRIAVANLEAARAKTGVIIDHLLEMRPMIAELVAQGRVHRPSLEWTRLSELAINARTGKARRVIDLRLSHETALERSEGRPRLCT